MIAEVVAAVRAAGGLVRKAEAAGLEPGLKGGEGPVTRADREVDAFLRRELLRLERCGWLSEESADDPRRLREPRVWVVDPLDGTLELLAGRPEYAVSVALVEAGVPVLAVVHNPATHGIAWAVRGGGSFHDGRPARVAEGSVLAASRTEVARGEFLPLGDAWEIHPVGSIAWKLALVAAGRAAATLSRGPKWEWDVCAGALLVEEAGERATDLSGGPLRFNRDPPRLRGIVAGAPGAWDRARRQAEALGPAREAP